MLWQNSAEMKRLHLKRLKRFVYILVVLLTILWYFRQEMSNKSVLWDIGYAIISASFCAFSTTARLTKSRMTSSAGFTNKEKSATFFVNYQKKSANILNCKGICDTIYCVLVGGFDSWLRQTPIQILPKTKMRNSATIPASKQASKQAKRNCAL